MTATHYSFSFPPARGNIAGAYTINEESRGFLSTVLYQIYLHLSWQESIPITCLMEMPPKQREAYKQFMEGMEEEAKEATAEKKLKVEIRKTSEKATVAGYSTQKYQVWVNGELKEELWISTEINLKDEIDLKKFAQLIEALSGAGEEESYESSPEYMGLMKQGYRLRSIDYTLGEKEAMREATKVEKKRIPDSEFKVPQGYRKVIIGEIFRQEMMEE